MKKPESLPPNERPPKIHSCPRDFQMRQPMGSENTEIDPCSSIISDLQQAIHAQLNALGFTKNGKGYAIEGQLTKQRIRDFHSKKRIEVLQNNKEFIEQYGLELVMNFATGRQIDPESIDPELIEVKPESKESQLFRFACLLWSVPVSQGFGRRLRFLVRDRQKGMGF